MNAATVSGAAVVAASSGTRTAERRKWWRREATRLGSDWNAIMELRASMAPLTCGVCGAAPCVNPSFCAACRVADQQTSWLASRCIPSRRLAGKFDAEHEAGRRCEGAEILRARRLLDAKVSLEHAWSEMQGLRGRAAASTVEALMYALRAGGTALTCPHTRRRLSELSEAQLHEVSARLQRFRPNIARPWTPVEVEMLVAIWVDLHG
jgi:hypothetical protein